VSKDNQSPELFGQTPWQTVGPFFHYALPWKGGADLIGASALGARPELLPEGHDQLVRSGEKGPVRGEAIEIRGRVFDGAGEPIPDALVEIWQADDQGRYGGGAADGFTGFGRCATGENGGFAFRTIMPGRVAGPGNTLQAPHLAVSILGRGLLKRLVTRIYFEDREGLDDDPVLALVPPARRGTLIAKPDAKAYGFDIHVQGDRETVFFEF
jgi:protocatechuate 3,4-dioxygenase, alpha subunit